MSLLHTEYKQYEVLSEQLPRFVRDRKKTSACVRNGSLAQLLLLLVLVVMVAAEGHYVQVA